MNSLKKALASDLNIHRKSIEDFRIVPCGLSHEALLKDKTSGLPVFYDLEGQKIFSNIGFCERKDRSTFLQCAHSTAWYRFLDCLKELKSMHSSCELYLPVEEINQVMLRIFELDHLKSALEKSKANLLYELQSEDINKIDLQLMQCSQQHSGFVQKLELHKKKILQSIDRSIKSMQQ